MLRFIFICQFLIAWALSATLAYAEPLDRETIANLVVPPYALGDPINENGVWSLLNSGGAEAGYVFETEPMSPLPGFSGTPINLLVMLDLNGVFIDVQLIAHNEPIFVSGLGEAAFHKFFEQYPGLSINSSIVVGTPYGSGSENSTLVYLDGVTKATASVRIAHESILAATLKVAREKMQGVRTQAPAYPKKDYNENLTWQDLVDQGIVARKLVLNSEVQELFKGTVWADDDAEALSYPDEPYLDLWVIDVGPDSIARAVFEQDTLNELNQFKSISLHDEPILFIETARHGLVGDEFVRNTSPSLIGMSQGGFPVALRDADLYITLKPDVPDGRALILRTDRRLGFDPASEWTVTATATREHGMFQPEVGYADIEFSHLTPDRFFQRPKLQAALKPWQEAILNRQTDLIIVSIFLVALTLTLLFAQNQIASWRYFKPFRLLVLGFVVGFIGWWGQGQLSIVTVMATINTAMIGSSFAYLLYDPFSLVIWAFAIFGFVLWGRGYFCGWLCPFGAMQEILAELADWLGLKQFRLNDALDIALKNLKYLLLLGLIAVTIFVPNEIDKAAEIEPFKTAITVFFIREWYYVLYAVLCLGLGVFFYKGFCRYVCPLGAAMAIGGFFRQRSWIKRRDDCGKPCQLCKVKCKYNSIKKSGDIQYSECFQCLDCVTIHNSPTQCVPLILQARKEVRVKL
jgi:NosR/NirI family nitrous oxide reductase transcriptional regulator